MGSRGPLTDSTSRNEPKPPLSSPRPPSWLNAAQQKIWKGKAPALIRQGVLTEWDRDALARYCVLMQQFVTLAEHSDQHDVPKELRDLNVQISKLEAAFGLTPASRTRVAATPPQRAEDAAPADRDRLMWQSLRRVKHFPPPPTGK